MRRARHSATAAPARSPRDAVRVLGLQCDTDAAEALAAQAARDLRRLRRGSVVNLVDFRECRDYLYTLLQDARRLRAALGSPK